MRQQGLFFVWTFFRLCGCVITTTSALTTTAIPTTTTRSDDYSSTPHQKIRYRCRVTYDGTGFSGFQLQATAANVNVNSNSDEKQQQRTVQGQLEQVLAQRLNRPVRVVGAGRTDAGVHARGQAVHFDLYANETTTTTLATSNNKNNNDECWNQALQVSMNRMLPDDIRVWNVQPAPPPCLEFVNYDDGEQEMKTWNVMRKCNAKLYSYRFCIGDSMDPLDRHTRWQPDWGHEIDVNRLLPILKQYEGTHDFRCFAGALEQAQRKRGHTIGTVRRIHSVRLVEEDSAQGLYRIDIFLVGALYKMVRNMVGTALDVCRGKVSEDKFLELLTNPSESSLSRKDNPCKPAPPQGLTLERVFYPNDDF
jgi:tRNA pseudouridine38-40 synthase